MLNHCKPRLAGAEQPLMPELSRILVFPTRLQVMPQ